VVDPNAVNTQGEASNTAHAPGSVSTDIGRPFPDSRQFMADVYDIDVVEEAVETEIDPDEDENDIMVDTRASSNLPNGVVNDGPSSQVAVSRNVPNGATPGNNSEVSGHTNLSHRTT